MIRDHTLSTAAAFLAAALVLAACAGGGASACADIERIIEPSSVHVLPGATVNYEAFINGGSVRTGSFIWSGTDENYLNLAGDRGQISTIDIREQHAHQSPVPIANECRSLRDTSAVHSTDYDVKEIRPE